MPVPSTTSRSGSCPSRSVQNQVPVHDPKALVFTHALTGSTTAVVRGAIAVVVEPVADLGCGGRCRAAYPTHGGVTGLFAETRAKRVLELAGPGLARGGGVARRSCWCRACSALHPPPMSVQVNLQVAAAVLAATRADADISVGRAGRKCQRNSRHRYCTAGRSRWGEGCTGSR